VVIATVLLIALGTLDPNGPISTAPERLLIPDSVMEATPAPAGQVPLGDHGMTTAQQIENWISHDRPRDGDAPIWRSTEARRPVVEMSAGVGTGGYRDYGGTIILPLARGGSVGLSYRHTENGHGLARDWRDEDVWFGASAVDVFRAQERRSRGAYSILD